MATQPIVILGGFLITDEAYQPMRHWLEQRSGQPVQLVPANRLDWLLTVGAWGWRRLLDRTAALVQELASCSPTGKVTLIGHSSGGVMLRLFLGDEPFAGRRYNGAALADRLFCLGSPPPPCGPRHCGSWWIVATRAPSSPMRWTMSP